MLLQLSAFPDAHILTQGVASVSRQPCWYIFMRLWGFPSRIGCRRVPLAAVQKSIPDLITHRYDTHTN
jgi:hypothetical protein